MPDSSPNPAPAQPTTPAEPSVKLLLATLVDPCISSAMQQNGIALLKSVTIENCGTDEARNLVARVRAEPDFAAPLELRLTSLAAGAQHTWTGPRIDLSPTFLAELRERFEGSLHVEVVADGCQPLTARHGVAVLAYDQWGGVRSLPELLCAFVLPNHPTVALWLKHAATLLEQWSGDPSLSGYQSKSRERVQQTAAAVFHALQASGVTYVGPPAHFERDGQKVRTPDRVNDEKLATCLDLAAVAAACLEQAGLHALLVLVEGHAFAGVWLDETSFHEPAIDDAALLIKRVELGEVCVFDPTLVTNRPACGFDAAISAARTHLADPAKFSCAIDVLRSRKGGIRPLPLRADGVVVEATEAAPEVDSHAPALSLPRRARDVTQPETPAGRIERWKRRLLDLTNRNRLLNFVESKKTVPLSCAELNRLEGVLTAGRKLTLRSALSEQQPQGQGARPIDPGTIRALLDRELDAGRLVTQLGHDQLEARLTEIFRAAREGLEEGGASGLYVALGFLEWFESPTSDRPRLAPLILVPVDIQRGSIRQGFKLSRAADETRFNTTLVEMLNAQFHVQIPGIEPLPEDEQGVDVVAVLQQIRAAVRDVPRWRVLEDARLGFFTFAKFLMWKDLDAQSEILLQNRIVSHLVHQPERAFDPDWRDPAYDSFDETYRTADLYCPVLADSSQLAAVVSAAGGKSFVLSGPPGTGKSQTITNLIAHCLAHGKTVLFVSEKTAALNVVFDRLKKIGLERFCLELHSNKANKAEVVRRLGESLRGAREHAPDEWTRTAEELDRARAELNAYARAVHRTHANGLSVFRATSLLTALRDAACVDLGWSEIGTVDRARLDACRLALREAQNALAGVGSPHGHALDGVGVEDVPSGFVDRAHRCFDQLRREIDARPVELDAASRALAVDLDEASEGELRLIDSACKLAVAAPESGFGLVAGDPTEARTLVEAICTNGRRRDEVRAALTQRFDVRLAELDLLALRSELRMASESWALGRWMRTGSIRKRLRGVTNPGVEPSLADMQAGVESALQLKELEATLVSALVNLNARADAAWRGSDSPWREIESALSWAIEARKSLSATRGDAQSAPGIANNLARWIKSAGGPAQLRLTLEACTTTLARLFDAATAVAAVLRFANDDPWNAKSAPRRLQAWRERVDLVEPALTQVKPWALWRRLRARLINLDLRALIGGVERGALKPDELAASFDRSFYEAWLDSARAQEPALRNFLSLSHDQRIAEFRALDERSTKLVSRVIAARLSARVPSATADAVPGSELGVLNRQIQLQRKHLGPRQLFQQTRSLVQRLKPCFLMSPISVAQYLPPGELAFDLVVFDEASQIPTWDAVGAIARGDQAIVVGDSKQLPPTSFFDAVVEGDDTDDHAVEDLESILDECSAANVPALDLRWHYRSRHESLITFSNRNYYENRLATFPAATIDGLGVQWRHVPGGVYDKGHSRTNRGEAAALVAEVLRRLRDPELAKHSIGVVTFSAAQQLKIEDMLDDERRIDPGLDRFFIGSDEVREPVFVKNLENVQGDERDVILFSICYGPDETGRVSMSFGPINLQGGERRLNVAVTRARRELVVFSTLTADQIDLTRTRSRGVADLRLFLAYAQHGLRVLPAAVTLDADGDEFDSPLEQEICGALRARGYTVKTQIGCSGYRIDLAVVNPDQPGRFLVGIECDGANYHSARTARDRDRLRQSVLEGLGWKLLRVWSSDWWESRQEQIERLCTAIDETRRIEVAHTPPPPTPPPVATPETAIESGPSAALAHTVFASAPAPHSASAAMLPAEDNRCAAYKAREPRQLGTQDDFYDLAKTRRVQLELEAVLTEEGPISLSLAAARVAACFGFERTRQKVVDRINDIAHRARIERTQQMTGIILWPGSCSPREWRHFRGSAPGDADARSSSDLPAHEIANAAAHILATNGACPRRDLQRALSRLFGFKALGGTVANHLDEGIDHLIAAGRARLDGDGRVEAIA